MTSTLTRLWDCLPASTLHPRNPSSPITRIAPNVANRSNSSPPGSPLAPQLFPQPEAFNLDFHAIPYRGDPAGLDNHYSPLRGKAGPSVLTFFAHEQKAVFSAMPTPISPETIKAAKLCDSSNTGTT